jgi:mannan endo-1,4-beta-mannosidase
VRAPGQASQAQEVSSDPGAGRWRPARFGLPADWRQRRTVIWAGAVSCGALVVAAVIPLALAVRSGPAASTSQPITYLGVYERDAPRSYGGISAFAATTGVRQDVVMYYSSWKEPFATGFAQDAAEHGAAPLVQINPYDVSLAAIAAGTYDGYLRSYAEAVRAFGRPVILSFGHEMNGHWYPWSYLHASPKDFVAAWRHIVTVFRGLGVTNVTWLWTVNIIETPGGIESPGPWWPGASYVNWVGIDGYYYKPSLTFAPLFGPTIAAIRMLTPDPILIAETGAPVAYQPEKIADLFAGVRLYGLLGFVWFDAAAGQDWRLSGPAAVHAFRQGARAYRPRP